MLKFISALTNQNSSRDSKEMGVKIEEETTENNRNNVAINLYMLTWNDLKVKFFKGELQNTA